VPFSPYASYPSAEEVSSVETKPVLSEFTPLDLTVKSPQPQGAGDIVSRKRKHSGSEEEDVRKATVSSALASHADSLSIVPPTPNPFINPDLLSPLALAPVPTPYMPLYNIGSPAPAPPSSSLSSVTLTPPQTPQGTSPPSFQLPPNRSLAPEMPYLMGFQPQLFSSYYGQQISNQYNPNLMQSMANKTPSPPPISTENPAKRMRQLLPKPVTPPGWEDSPSRDDTLVSPQMLTINNQTIHIKPLPPSPVNSNFTDLRSPFILPAPANSQQSLLYQPPSYQSYQPLPTAQVLRNQDSKPMSQALSFLFEKSLGSVQRWRENGITVQVFYCTVCQMPTDNEDRMRTHIECFHSELASITPSSNGVYQCLQCEQICSDEASLARHKLIHITSTSYSERCKGCGRNFSSADYLENHEKECSMYRPYRCDWCGKAYVVAARLKHHRMECSAGPTKPVFSCKVCSKNFDNFLDYCHHVPVHAFM